MNRLELVDVTNPDTVVPKLPATVSAAASVAAATTLATMTANATPLPTTSNTTHTTTIRLIIAPSVVSSVAESTNIRWLLSMPGGDLHPLTEMQKLSGSPHVVSDKASTSEEQKRT